MHNRFGSFGLAAVKFFRKFWDNLKDKKIGFTLAEVLIALAVIGVIAVLVLPAVTTRAQNKAFETSYETQVKNLLNSLEALPLVENASSIDGTMMFSANANLDDFASTSGTYIQKYMKVSKYCGNTPSGCFADNYTELKNNAKTAYSTDNIKGACASLKNGVSLCLRPAQRDESGNGFVSGYFDLNGKKGPNVYGRDLRSFLIDIEEATVYNAENPDQVITVDNSDIEKPEDCNGICTPEVTPEQCPAGTVNAICCNASNHPNLTDYNDPCCKFRSGEAKCNRCSDLYENKPVSCTKTCAEEFRQECCSQDGFEHPKCCSNASYEAAHKDYCCGVNPTSLACCLQDQDSIKAGSTCCTVLKNAGETTVYNEKCSNECEINSSSEACCKWKRDNNQLNISSLNDTCCKYPVAKSNKYCCDWSYESSWSSVQTSHKSNTTEQAVALTCCNATTTSDGRGGHRDNCCNNFDYFDSHKSTCCQVKNRKNTKACCGYRESGSITSMYDKCCADVNGNTETMSDGKKQIKACCRPSSTAEFCCQNATELSQQKACCSANNNKYNYCCSANNGLDINDVQTEKCCTSANPSDEFCCHKKFPDGVKFGYGTDEYTTCKNLGACMSVFDTDGVCACAFNPTGSFSCCESNFDYTKNESKVDEWKNSCCSQKSGETSMKDRHPDVCCGNGVPGVNDKACCNYYADNNANMIKKGSFKTNCCGVLTDADIKHQVCDRAAPDPVTCSAGQKEINGLYDGTITVTKDSNGIYVKYTKNAGFQADSDEDSQAIGDILNEQARIKIVVTSVTQDGETTYLDENVIAHSESNGNGTKVSNIKSGNLVLAVDVRKYDLGSDKNYRLVAQDTITLSGDTASKVVFGGPFCMNVYQCGEYVGANGFNANASTNEAKENWRSKCCTLEDKYKYDKGENDSNVGTAKFGCCGWRLANDPDFVGKDSATVNITNRTQTDTCCTGEDFKSNHTFDYDLEDYNAKSSVCCTSTDARGTGAVAADCCQARYTYMISKGQTPTSSDFSGCCADQSSDFYKGHDTDVCKPYNPCEHLDNLDDRVACCTSANWGQGSFADAAGLTQNDFSQTCCGLNIINNEVLTPEAKNTIALQCCDANKTNMTLPSTAGEQNVSTDNWAQTCCTLQKGANGNQDQFRYIDLNAKMTGENTYGSSVNEVCCPYVADNHNGSGQEYYLLKPSVYKACHGKACDVSYENNEYIAKKDEVLSACTWSTPQTDLCDAFEFDCNYIYVYDDNGQSHLVPKECRVTVFSGGSVEVYSEYDGDKSENIMLHDGDVLSFEYGYSCKKVNKKTECYRSLNSSKLNSEDYDFGEFDVESDIKVVANPNAQGEEFYIDNDVNDSDYYHCVDRESNDIMTNCRYDKYDYLMLYDSNSSGARTIYKYFGTEQSKCCGNSDFLTKHNNACYYWGDGRGSCSTENDIKRAMQRKDARDACCSVLYGELWEEFGNGMSGYIDSCVPIYFDIAPTKAACCPQDIGGTVAYSDQTEMERSGCFGNYNEDEDIYELSGGDLAGCYGVHKTVACNSRSLGIVSQVSHGALRSIYTPLCAKDTGLEAAISHVENGAGIGDDNYTVANIANILHFPTYVWEQPPTYSYCQPMKPVVGQIYYAPLPDNSGMFDYQSAFGSFGGDECINYQCSCNPALEGTEFLTDEKDKAFAYMRNSTNPQTCYCNDSTDHEVCDREKIVKANAVFHVDSNDIFDSGNPISILRGGKYDAVKNKIPNLTFESPDYPIHAGGSVVTVADLATRTGNPYQTDEYSSQGMLYKNADEYSSTDSNCFIHLSYIPGRSVIGCVFQLNTNISPNYRLGGECGTYCVDKSTTYTHNADGSQVFGSRAICRYENCVNGDCWDY